jgi:hypothetical protein
MRRQLSRLANVLTVERLGILLAFIGIAVMLIGHINQYGTLDVQRLFADMYANVGAELLSIALTVLLIDKLVERRDKHQQKERLIREMGSRDSGTALSAVDELRARGWLTDGSLIRADLKYANLADANLADAVMPGAYLTFAVLKAADLRNANLRGAILRAADLREALLLNTDLTDTKILDANLQNAKMQGAILAGAHIAGSDLTGVRGLSDERFASASKLHKSIMPTGARYDGRYNLPGDVAGLDPLDTSAMADYYGISADAYQKGQAWSRSKPSA